MLIKLFVLGGPGSGKSTMVRHIQPLIRDEQWSHERLNDYSILQEMTDEDSRKPANERRLRWLDEQDRLKGFDVLDVGAFDDALKRLEKEANRIFEQQNAASLKPCLATIEFARNDYQRAFQQFSREFLQGSYYLYLDSSVEICKQRIHTRVEQPPKEKTPDDYYVSDYIFRAYYDHVNDVPVSEILKSYGIPEQHIQVINNDVELGVVLRQVYKFVQGILNGDGELSKQETAEQHQVDTLPEKEGLQIALPTLRLGTAFSFD